MKRERASFSNGRLDVPLEPTPPHTLSRRVTRNGAAIAPWRTLPPQHETSYADFRINDEQVVAVSSCERDGERFVRLSFYLDAQGTESRTYVLPAAAAAFIAHSFGVALGLLDAGEMGILEQEEEEEEETC